MSWGMKKKQSHKEQRVPSISEECAKAVGLSLGDLVTRSQRSGPDYTGAGRQ